jgi:Tol biopolymer transport system component
VPFWSADETEIFFSRAVISEGKVSTWRVPSDGSGPAVRLASGLGMTVSPDGSSLLMIRSTGEAFLSFNRADTTDIWLLPIDEPESEILLKQGPSTQYVDGISPDGEYLLYASSVSGQFTLYLTRFPSMQGRWQVSADGNAGIPCFSRDGSIIYYESEGTVYAVDFQSGPSPVLGKPRSVLTMPEGTQDELQVDGSGEGFLVVMSAEDEGKDSSGPNRQGIKIVQNWTAGIH